MPSSSPAMLLGIYTDEAARHGGRPLFEDLVLRARAAGLAGATVLRGPMGDGRSARIHTANIIDLSASLPLVVEIVDTELKLRTFAAQLSAEPNIALATLERVEVVGGDLRKVED